MSKNEKIKEQIGWLKVAFGLFTAVAFSLIGYMVQNYDKISTLLMFLSFISFLGTCGIIVLINKLAFKKMDELE